MTTEELSKTLCEYRAWTNFITEPRPNGKLSKIPCDANAQPVKGIRTNWAIESGMTVKQAINNCNRNDFIKGVGFILGKQEDGKTIAAIDLDNCIDIKASASESLKSVKFISEDYQKIYNKAIEHKLFIEKSYSGKGIHVYGFYSGKEIDRNRFTTTNGNEIEVYASGRYIASGPAISDINDFGDITELIDFALSLSPVNSQKKEENAFDAPFTLKPAFSCSEYDFDIIAKLQELYPYEEPAVIAEKINNSKTDNTKKLFDGNAQNYNSHSEADAALYASLAYWCVFRKELAIEVFRLSGLYREEKARSDYHAATISAAWEKMKVLYSENELEGYKKHFPKLKKFIDNAIQSFELYGKFIETLNTDDKELIKKEYHNQKSTLGKLAFHKKHIEQNESFLSFSSVNSQEGEEEKEEVFRTNRGKLLHAKLGKYIIEKEALKAFRLKTGEKAIMVFNGKYYQRLRKDELQSLVRQYEDNATEKEIRETICYIETKEKPAELKENAYCVCFENTAFDIYNRKFFQPTESDCFTEEDYFPFSIPETFEELKEKAFNCNTFAYKTLLAWSCGIYDRIKMMCEMAGSAFIKRQYRKFWYCSGKTGANGKGEFASLLKKIFGKSYITTSLELLQQEKHRYELNGKRIAVDPEADSKKANSRFLKSITGGDSIQSRALYSAQVEDTIPAKLIFFTNSPQHFDDMSAGAIKDRLMIIQFKADFRKLSRKEKDDFAEAMRDKANIEDFIILFLYSACEVAQNGFFTCKEQEDASNEFIREIEPIREFIDITCGGISKVISECGDKQRKKTIETLAKEFNEMLADEYNYSCSVRTFKNKLKTLYNLELVRTTRRNAFDKIENATYILTK